MNHSNIDNIDEVLDQALERVAAGEPLDAVVNSFPQTYHGRLYSLLSFTEALDEIAHDAVPLPSSSRRVSAKKNFLAAAALERDQQHATLHTSENASATAGIDSLSIDSLSTAPPATPTPPVRPKRTLVEPEPPTFLERLGSIFASPAARLAPIALTLLLLLGGGWFVASDSYPGSVGFGLKQTARNIGNSLVPESARGDVLIAQGEAKQGEIERAKQMAAVENVEVNWRDTTVVVAIEEGPDGYNINTTSGDFTVTEEDAVDVIRSQLKEGRLGEGAEIRADLLIQAEKPQQVEVVDLEVIATPDADLAEAVVTAAAQSPTVVPVAIPEDTCIRTIPENWQPYTVVAGDTLITVAGGVESSYSELASVNCIGNADQIDAGDTIYLPPVALVQPTPVETSTSIPTVTLEPTFINQTPTDAPMVGTTVVPSQIDTPVPNAPVPTSAGTTTVLTITAPIEPTAAATLTPTTVESTIITATPTIISTVVLTTTEPTEVSPPSTTITATVPLTVTQPDAEPAAEVTPTVLPVETGDDETGDDSVTITNTVPITVTETSGDEPSPDAETPTSVPLTVTTSAVEGASLDATPTTVPEIETVEPEAGAETGSTSEIAVTVVPTTTVPTIAVTSVPEGDSESTGIESVEPSEPETTDEQTGEDGSAVDVTVESATPPPIIATATVTQIVTIEAQTTLPSVLNEPTVGQSTEEVVPAEISPQPIPVVTVVDEPEPPTVPEPESSESTDGTAGETSIEPAPVPVPVAPTSAPTSALNVEPTESAIITPQVVEPATLPTVEPVEPAPIEVTTTSGQSESSEAAPIATAIVVSTVAPIVAPTIAPTILPTVIPPTPTAFIVAPALPPTALPVQPAPEQPAPTQPAPVQPDAVQPDAVQPASIQPTPTWTPELVQVSPLTSP